jgi:hypothetical protein
MACKLAGGQQPTVRMIAPFSIFNCSVHQRLQRWLPEHLGRQPTKEEENVRGCNDRSRRLIRNHRPGCSRNACCVHCRFPHRCCVGMAGVSPESWRTWAQYQTLYREIGVSLTKNRTKKIVVCLPAGFPHLPLRSFATSTSQVSIHVLRSGRAAVDRCMISP